MLFILYCMTINYFHLFFCVTFQKEKNTKCKNTYFICVYVCIYPNNERSMSLKKSYKYYFL